MTFRPNNDVLNTKGSTTNASVFIRSQMHLRKTGTDGVAKFVAIGAACFVISHSLCNLRFNTSMGHIFWDWVVVVENITLIVQCIRARKNGC